MFLVARITTIQDQSENGDGSDKDDSVFGVPRYMQAFFQAGLLGALITTICASLVWRVIASCVPLAFLSNPLVHVIIGLCLWLETSGLCSAAWALASIHKRVAMLQPDEMYLGIHSINREAPPCDDAVETTSLNEV